MKLLIQVLCALLALAMAPAGHAAGGGGGGVSKPKCKAGYVYSSWHRKCVKQQSGAVPDRALLDQGWALAEDGEYRAAIAAFRLVGDIASPEKYNGLGYSYRKLGQIDLGIQYYNTALMIDPDYLLARNYLAKGYLAAGRLDEAAAQLAQIERRCAGEACALADDLRQSLAARFAQPAH